MKRVDCLTIKDCNGIMILNVMEIDIEKSGGEYFLEKDDF